jgi:hypothetical protein
MVYDLESFLDDLNGVLKAHLNDEVLAIVAGKNGLISVPTIDADAYYFQTLDQRVVNYSPAVFVFVSNGIPDDSAGGGVVATYEIDVYVIFGNQNQPDLERLLFRYHEALKNTIANRWKTFTRLDCRITSLEPAGFAALNQTQVVRATGLTIEVTFGN